MRIIVQKFGGTSLSSAERRGVSAQRILKAKEEGYSPVVVVSAMGRVGDPYATDTLLGLIEDAGGKAESRDVDLLVSCGEIISAAVMASTLNAKGLQTCVLTGGQAGIITDGAHNHAKIMKVDPTPLLGRLRQGDVVVVAGFQGLAEGGEVTTLGRGGSDITATALGAALGAEMVEIYTDVDGIKTADPRLVPNARTIEVVTYDEICQLAHEGAKVIHPRAVEIAMQKQIPLKIRSTFSDSPGTLVTWTGEGTEWHTARDLRPVTGVTHIPHVAQVMVGSGGSDLGFFRILAKEGVSVDMINVTGDLRAFIVTANECRKTQKILQDTGYHVQVTTGLSKVSVVGYGMRGLPGVMANVVEALVGSGVSLLQTADSHVTISCLVREEDTEKALKALHDKFGLGGV